MKRRLIRVVFLVLFGLASGSVSAHTHCVPNSFLVTCNDSHPTIQDALNEVTLAAGDVILVAPGTYVENLTVSDSVILQGAQAGVDARGRVVGIPSAATESIIAPSSGVGLTLQTGSVGTTIDGFSFKGGTIAIQSSTTGPIDRLEIQNNHIAEFTGNAIFLSTPGIDITAFQNVIDGTSKIGGGALFHLDPDNFAGFHLDDNILRNGSTATGFFCDGDNTLVASVSRAPRISGNLIVDNNTGMNLGSRSFDGGTIEDNTFESNNFDGLQGGIQNSSVQNNFFRGNGRSGLALTSFGNAGADRGAQNLTITCNDFTGNLSEGIFFSASQAVGTIATNVVNDNNISGNTAGVSYSNTETINVEENWWGAASGPTVASNPGGTGDSLTGGGSANFDYVPFLAFTADCVPGQPPPDLTITKTVSDSTPREGDEITFTITLANTNNGGPGTLVSVSDVLPAGLTYETDSSSQGFYTPGTGVWDVGTMQSPNGTATLQILATVNASTAGSTITNTASITTSTPADSSPANNTATVNITIGPQVPSAFSANRSGATVFLAWNPSAGADHYEILRASPTSGGYVFLTSTTESTFVDAAVSPDTVYAYKARALDANANSSPFSIPDAATTFVFTDDPLISGTTAIKNVHITQARTVVNSLRACAGLTAISFADTPLNPGMLIRKTHIDELRTGLTAARNALGLPALSFTDPTLLLGVTQVRRFHISDVRTGVK